MLKLSQPQGHSASGEMKTLKNPMGNRTRPFRIVKQFLNELHYQRDRGNGSEMHEISTGCSSGVAQWV
jgi:hypothetical protein